MVLVIGYGNPLRQDDGVGWHVAERLSETADAAAVRCLALHQLTPDLAAPLSRAALAIFIDARDGGTPGSAACRLLQPAETTPESFSHRLDPPALLAATRSVYGTCPDSYLITVSGGAFGYGEKLSLEVESAVGAVLEGVAALAAIARKA